jgi:hypothetical protein
VGSVLGLQSEFVIEILARLISDTVVVQERESKLLRISAFGRHVLDKDGDFFPTNHSESIYFNRVTWEIETSPIIRAISRKAALESNWIVLPSIHKGKISDEDVTLEKIRNFFGLDSTKKIEILSLQSIRQKGSAKYVFGKLLAYQNHLTGKIEPLIALDGILREDITSSLISQKIDMAAIGFPDDTEKWRKYWPASVHIIGKDIVRFHTVYWPAFLMSAGLPLPKMVFGHGFLLSRGEKMSKSLGNVVDPMALAELFGVDALRYFLLREVSFGQDGSYSPEAIVTRVNADLANSFGNLAQRTLSLIFKNCEGYLPAIHGHHADDQALLELVGNAVSNQIPAHFEDLAMSQALDAWMQAVFACNAYVDVQAPWALKKTDPERMETVLATLFICIAQLAIAVQPIIPGSATKLLDQMGVPENVRNFANAGSHWYSPLAEGGFQIAQPQGLFPRLELPPEEGAST